MIALPRPCVCLVTNRSALGTGARSLAVELASLERLLDEAIDAGVDLIQIRERDLEARALLSLTDRVMARAASTNTRVVVNDRADVAMAAGAGVHLRSDGPAAARVRAFVGETTLVGRSVHAPAEAASETAADYLLFGTVFPSQSKGPGAPIAGEDALRSAASVAAVPVLAIGGVTPARVAACRAAGAAGVAAIGVFLPPGSTPEALGPAAGLAALRQAWDDGARC